MNLNIFFHSLPRTWQDISELRILQLIAEHINANVYIRQNGKRVDVNAANRDSVLQVISLFEDFPLQSSKHKEFLIWKEFVQSSIQWSSKGSLYPFEQVHSHFESLAKQLQEIQDNPNSS